MIKTIHLIIFLTLIFTHIYAQNEDNTVAKIKLSEAEYLYKIADFTKDSAFSAAYNSARKKYNPAKEDFLLALTESLLEYKPENMLAEYYCTAKFKDEITSTSTNQEVINVLQKKIKLAKEKTISVLKKRTESAFKPSSFLASLIDNTQVEITELPENNTYLVTINKKVSERRLTKLLQAQTDFSFWETYNNQEIWEYLELANAKIKEIEDNRSNPEHEKTDINKGYSLFEILKPSVSYDNKPMWGTVIGISHLKDTSLINKYLAKPEIISLFPKDLKFMWDTKPFLYDKQLIKLNAIKITNRNGLPAMNGDYIIETKVVESNNQFEVNIAMNIEGAKIWALITKKNIGRQIAMVLNNSVYSNPIVNCEINGGKTAITGNFSSEEATDLASLLNAGSLPGISVKVIAITN